MLDAIRWSYARAWSFVRLCPLLALIPAAAELAQHVAEFHIGMYASIAAAKAVAYDPLRMALGHVKVIAIMLIGLSAGRFAGFGDSPRAAWRIDGPALRCLVPVVAWLLLLLLVGLDGGSALAAAGVERKAAQIILLGVTILSIPIGFGLNGWIVAASLGDERIGPIRSLKMSWGSYWWTAGLTLFTILPPMAAHYVLSYAAMGREPAVTWLLLAIDTTIAAFMAPLIGTIRDASARRVTGRAGIELGMWRD